MKLIHTTNLWLDAQMDATLSAEQARQRRADVLRDFSKLMGYARKHAVDAVLIVGGLLDPQRATRETLARVLDEIASASAVSVLWVRTPEEAQAFAEVDRPPNLAIFGRDWLRLIIGGVALTCIEMGLPNCEFAYGDLYCAPDMPNVVALRGQPATTPGLDAVSLPDLRGKGISYLALGGADAPKQGKLEPKVSWVQPGSIEPHSFADVGDRGFYLVDVPADGRLPQATFVPYARRRYVELWVDAAEAHSAAGLAKAAQRAADQVGARKRDLVRVHVAGLDPLAFSLDVRELRERLASRFFYTEVELDPQLQLERSAYELDVSLRGEFVRTVLSCDLPEGEAARVLRAGLAALAGQEVTL